MKEMVVIQKQALCVLKDHNARAIGAQSAVMSVMMVCFPFVLMKEYFLCRSRQHSLVPAAKNTK